MPAKGSKYLLPNRDQVVDMDLWKRFKEKYESDISYKDFMTIIKASNKTIYDAVLEDERGFKFPHGLGYIAVTKYRTKTKSIDWAATQKYNKKIYHLNLHSFGWCFHIKWFRTGICNFEFHKLYRMVPHRFLKRALSKNVREGKDYQEWQIKDYWDFNKLEKIYNKKIK